MTLTIRRADQTDLPALRALMDRAIRELQRDFLNDAQVAASIDVMGLDRALIDDGTYFVAEDDGRVAGCGGWSRRATLFGGDDSVVSRDPRLLDPASEPARIRAMYTDPAFTRRGVGRAILTHCEDAVVAAGFASAEMMATLTGQPLYRACGYAPVEEIVVPTRSGVGVPLIRMAKRLVG